MGPFPTAVQQLKFLVVGIDYFIKWVEAETLATITEKNVRSFIWRCIICRFGIPRVLVSDNGKQFDNDSFRDFCSRLGIRNHYSSPAHLQPNGQVKVTNRFLLKIIKTWLDGAKGIWPEELPSILWAYRTMARTPIAETPFWLTYGSEVVIRTEVGLISYRVHNHNESKNDKAIRLQLDLVDEVRATAEQRLARYQDRMAKHYNSRVRHRDFQVVDLVLRKVMGAARDPMGRTLLNHVMAEEGHLPLGDNRQIEATTSMEHRALAKVLPIKKTTWRTTPPFIYNSLKQILVILLSFIIYFSFCDSTIFFSF